MSGAWQVVRPTMLGEYQVLEIREFLLLAVLAEANDGNANSTGIVGKSIQGSEGDDEGH